MKDLIKTRLGRFRIIAFLEGLTLLFLVFVAVPMKYGFDIHWGSEVVGPIHGALFLLFVYYTFLIARAHGWKFWGKTWKVLLSCFIPFGTFYIDHIYLSKMDHR